MRPILAILAILLILLPGFPLKAQTSPPRPLAFTHVTVIDGTGAKPKTNQTVLVTGDRITAVGQTGKVKIPEDAQVVDATGKFLIPGLWDMHVHATTIPHFCALYIANGVTGVRDMFSPGVGALLPLRKQIGEGKAIGPRLVFAGRIVDGPQPVWQGSVEAKTVEEGRQAVHTVQKDGSDFVKVYSKLPRDVYIAIVDEAKKQKLPFAGHVPSSVRAAEASDLGQRSMEHLYEVLKGCSSQAEPIQKAFAEAVARLEKSQPDYGKQVAVLARERDQKIQDTYDPKIAAALFAKFKKNRTWQCPTLTVLRNIAFPDDKTITEDPRVNYLPTYATNSWGPNNDSRLRTWTPEDFERAKQNYRKHVELVGTMRKAGVEFLAGTDVMNPYCLPGFSLHDELALLVQAGLTPMEALQAATRNPARFFGNEKEMGTVQAGKLADLVLLDADPLQDIRNTTKIRAVVANGRTFDRAALDKLLADAEKAAGRKVTLLPEEEAALHAGCCPHVP
jgi:imidazolonepropionase-like amidohydrolase